jgi:hypothetical protein
VFVLFVLFDGPKHRKKGGKKSETCQMYGFQFLLVPKHPHPVGSGKNVFSCTPERIKPWKSFLHEVKSPLHKLSWLSQLLFTSNLSLIDLTFINAI